MLHKDRGVETRVEVKLEVLTFSHFLTGEIKIKKFGKEKAILEVF
jgi:hypothetical protein